jgi:hypothetical protein
MKKTALALFLFLGALPLFAQHGQNGYTGFSLTSPAQISVGSDKNFLVDRTPADQKLFYMSLPASLLPAAPDLRPLKLDDTVYLVKAPTLAFLSDTQKREFSLTYQPEFELFKTNSDQNSWNHSASMDFSYLLTRRGESSCTSVTVIVRRTIPAAHWRMSSCFCRAVATRRTLFVRVSDSISRSGRHTRCVSITRVRRLGRTIPYSDVFWIRFPTEFRL